MTPSRRRRSISVRRAPSGSCDIADSVTSRRRCSGRAPDARSAPATSAGKPGSASCRAETLTATVTPHSAARAVASRSTNAPSGTISPVSSAIATNACGSTSQRQSASKPVISPVPDAQDRLVEHLHAARLDRAPQVGLEVEPRDDVAVHLRVEHRVARLAVRLGAVHGDVGVADQLLRVGVGPAERDPDRPGDHQLAVGDRERLGERGQHPLRDDRRLARVGHVLQQDGELVAADPRDGVAGAQRGVEPARDRLEQPVAGLVAERVVDELEAVEVEEQHGGAAVAVAAARAAQRLLEPVEEQRPVREPGERVVERAVAEPLDGAAVVGGVADRALERVRVEAGLREVVDGAGGARRRDGGGAARVAEDDQLRARVLLQQRADRRLVAELRVDQDGVVRVLADRGQGRGRRGRPVDLCATVVQQAADESAVGLVGGDEEQDEGRLGHGPISDGRPHHKTEQ